MPPIDPKQWERLWAEASASARDVFADVQNLDDLEAARVRLLGRSGALSSLLRDLKELPVDERRRLGGPANELRGRLEVEIDALRRKLERAGLDSAAAKAPTDPTLPAAPATRGRLHPLTLVTEEMLGIFSRLGFALAEGPQVETEYYNFDALNFPADHPAKDMQDTFYLKTEKGFDALLLRTHTSNVQIRRMLGGRPPVRIVVPGRVFRHEAVDASHSAVFHQIEGLYVDKNVSMADLKGTLVQFLQALFGSQTKTRFRPSFFPFTEPSAEMDISCLLCAGKGCPACKRTGWMEILGAGLVHPNVLRGVDYNPETWSGFAFGLGVERIAMLKLGITDIRTFYENDVRFLEQFG